MNDSIDNAKNFSRIFSTSALGACIVDLNLHFLSCNNSFSNFLKYSEKELQGKTIADVTHPLDRELGQSEIKAIVQGTLDNAKIRKRYVRKDGVTVWGEVNISLIRDQDGKPLYFFPFIEDIEERLRLEKEADFIRGKFEQLIALAADAFFQGSPSGRIILINEAAEELTGYSKQELLGMSMKDLFSEETLQAAPLRYDLLERGETVKTIRPLSKKDGTTVIIEMHSRKKPDGTYQSFFMNIDEQKAKELRTANLLSEKTILLKEVHHRIKNNLTTIISLLNLQAHETEDEKTRDVFNEAISRINTMQKLYEKLYVSTGYKDIDIREYLTDLMADIQNTLSAEGSVDFILELEPIMLGNESIVPLGIIVNELITNSAKHAFGDSKKGRIHIKLVKEDSTIKILYHDDGTGISERSPAGDGFGMLLIQLLTEQLGGTSSVSNENGFCYRLEFPLPA